MAASRSWRAWLQSAPLRLSSAAASRSVADCQVVDPNGRLLTAATDNARPTSLRPVAELSSSRSIIERCARWNVQLATRPPALALPAKRLAAV